MITIPFSTATRHIGPPFHFRVLCNGETYVVPAVGNWTRPDRLVLYGPSPAVCGLIDRLWVLHLDQQRVLCECRLPGHQLLSRGSLIDVVVELGN